MKNINYLPTPRPSMTQWGNADQAEEVAPGIWSVSTPSHGGFIVSRERLAAIPQTHLMASFGQQGLRGIFEEDCDWAIVACAFPDEFRAYIARRGIHAATQEEYMAAAQKMLDEYILRKN